MIGKFLRASRASIAVYAGVMLPVLAGMAGLGSEYGYGVMSRSQNQRVADAAAYAGAYAYATDTSLDAMNAAVSRMATLNGLKSTDAVAALVTSPSGSGKNAVQVTVTTTQKLALTQLISSKSSLTIVASAFAELTPGSVAGAGCVLALSSTGNGITLSGGTTLSAPGCALASNNTVTVPCGTSIVTATLYYNSAAVPSQGCSGITAPTGKTLKITKGATADWLTGNAGITAATANYATVAALTAPTGPTITSKTAITFGYSATGANSPTTLIASQSANGCSAAWASGTATWTVTCANNGTYTFGPIDLGGGITVKWAEAGTGSVYNFSGFIKVTGTKMTFGAGTYNIAAGLYTGGGSTTQFLQGATYRIGKFIASGCNNEYSICHAGSSLSFAGPVNMTLSNGMDSGTTVMAIGSGSTANTYNFGGGSSSGKVFNVGGGGKLTLGDASTGGSFTAVGNVTTGGGSCLTLPAASAHWIKGNVSAAGGLTLGSGVYTINGYFALGENNGGSVTCTTTSIGLKASGVALQVAGAATATGSCNGYVFCVSAGYTNVTLTAPATGSPGGGFAVIGPTSSTRTGGAMFGQGASGVSVSGVFYIPNGPLALAGGAGVGDGNGACLELVAKDITLSGGTALASTCSGLAGAFGGASTSLSVMMVK